MGEKGCWLSGAKANAGEVQSITECMCVCTSGMGRFAVDRAERYLEGPS